VSLAGLDALRARAYDDPELARSLRGVDPERFAGEVLRLAAELGCDVAADDLRAATALARQNWMLRWVR
jgi:hypothetical protein